MAVPSLRCLAFAAILAGVAGLSAVAQPLATNTGDLKIRRVNVSGEKLARALEQVEQGKLVRMTPSAFEKLLKEARSGRDVSQPSSAVTEARYRAKYVGGPVGESSLEGSAEWAIRRVPGAGPELPLPGFQLAVRQAKWSDGHDAVLYKLPGDPDARLHLPEGETRTLNLDWSAQASRNPAKFNLSCICRQLRWRHSIWNCPPGSCQSPRRAKHS